ncbi:MAG: lysozyme inhibitor LprI family protein [Bacteroidota bacterium]
MKKYAFLFWSLLGSLGCDSPKVQNNIQNYKKVCKRYDIVDSEMLETINQIEIEFVKDQIFLERFRNSQIYWIQYKDRHLRALYPQDWDLYYRKNYGKQVFNACKCKELIRITEARVLELKMYLEGSPKDQSECPSSWNKKALID